MNNTNIYVLADVLGIKTSQQLQGYVNKLENKYNKLETKGFGWERPQDQFYFEQNLKDLNIVPMAAVVDVQSDPIPIGKQGFSTTHGSIPRMKMIEKWDELKMREQARILNDRTTTADVALDAALTDLFVTTNDLYTAHGNTVTFMCDQARSTGAVKFTPENNPFGIAFEYKSPIPESNIINLATTKRWWTDKGTYKTEGSTSDPVTDLMDMVDKANNLGMTQVHFEVDMVYAKHIVNHSKVLGAIATSMYTFAPDTATATAAIKVMPWKDRLAKLGEIVGAPFEIVDDIVVTQKYSKSSDALVNTQKRAFASDVVVLVPNGEIGKILSVKPLKLPQGIYADRLGGRMQLETIYDYNLKTQIFRTELTCLPVLTMPQFVFQLFPSGK